ncbi:MAG: hypothetical protein R3E90_09220 [Marinicella sp.]
MKKIICVILLSLQTCIVLAQQGPIIECHNCEGQSDGPLPVQGNWYNPQQSGSGYLIDVQNGILSGFYFGYTDQGEPTWLSFSGPLQASEDANINWHIEAPLVKFTGGNAYNQPHQFPTNIVETGDVIRVDFHFAHYASVQINDGDVQRIIPINYGVAQEQDFPESDHEFPELEGVWNFVIKVNDPDLLGLFAFWGHDIYIPAKSERLFEDGTYRVIYFLSDWFYPESVNFAGIYCLNPINQQTNEREVVCELSNIPNIGDRMPVAPGNIGPNYIYAENANGDVFEAFRVNYIPNFGNPIDGK